jgi:hypothetical protein
MNTGLACLSLASIAALVCARSSEPLLTNAHPAALYDIWLEEIGATYEMALSKDALAGSASIPTVRATPWRAAVGGKVSRSGVRIAFGYPSDANVRQALESPEPILAIEGGFLERFAFELTSDDCDAWLAMLRQLRAVEFSHAHPLIVSRRIYSQRGDLELSRANSGWTIQAGAGFIEALDPNLFEAFLLHAAKSLKYLRATPVSANA